MDINKVFGLFEEQDSNENSVTKLDLTDSPAMWIGMFKKLIINYKVFSQQLINMFSLVEPPLDISDIKRASSYMVYTRAFDYISKINIENQNHIECLKLYSDENLKQSISVSLQYYESLEEYEKCAVLKKIQDIITLS
jgi:hypothetical protein